jgi:ABC-type branched-subunit amino acid transport system substrate-binding protein
MRITRGAAAGLALTLFLGAACTGAPRPQNLAAGKSKQVPDTSVAIGDGTTVDDQGNVVDAQGNIVAPAGSPAAKLRTGVSGAGGGGGEQLPPVVPGVKGADGITPANLYSGAEDRIGISDDNITLCGHAALIFAAAFDTSPADLNVYWQMVRDRGGIHGRNVTMTFEDDRYDPAAAQQAAETCKTKNPFLILGGIGFDQIPQVRNWAEANRMLYIHHIAVEGGAAGKKFSFTPQPSVEQVGKAFGEHIAAKHAAAKLGVVYRQSDNWEPGSKAGEAELKKRGVDIVASVPVQKNQAVYTQQIQALRGKADVVWLWENALGAAEFIRQAWDQQYFPTFVVFPFQTTLDVVAGDGLKSPIEGVATWSAYKQGGYGATPFAAHGYDAEIKAFEAAMAKYRPGVKPNDILWQVWLSNKALDDLFQRCGRNCSRNKFAGIFLSGLKSTVAPNCEVDFTRGNPYKGGYKFTTIDSFESGSTAYYRTKTWCADHLI